MYLLAVASLFSLAAALSQVSDKVSSGKLNPDTVPALDVSKYLGLWYQMAADQIVYSTFEKDSYCATALYGLNSDGTLSVHNYAKTSSPTGATYVIDGYAYQTDATSHPGQLKVVFNSDDAAPFPAPYWILELGPINSDGLYDYAIVSDNLSAFLFVLARDVNTFNTKYKASVSATLTKLGFTGKTAPIDTYQNSDCIYEATARKIEMSKPIVAPENGNLRSGKFNPDTVPALDVSKYLDTVPALDVSKYLGLWYQMAADQIVYSTFEKDSYCATALYGLNSDGTLSVHNYAKTSSPTGATYVIDGYAYQTDATSHPGQLKVVFNSDDAAPFPAPYWILELGPINSDGLYDYAIVSDNLSAFLFVLARDVNTFNTKYKASVSATLTKLGFTGKTAPIDTYQNSDCIYEATARKNEMQRIGSGKLNPDTVTTLDVPKYMGLWYQMASDAIVYATFEKDAFCATALYGINNDGTLSVHNYAKIGSQIGTTYVIDGYAYQTDATSHPGQLKVVFDSDDASPFPAPYWILELGPINSDGLYDYAIVSDNFSSTLFVLARNVNTFNTQYKASVSATLTKLGFTGKTAPIDMYQNSDCIYEAAKH
eukprot:gene7835-10641_t